MEEMFTSLSTYGYLILFLYSFGGGFVALMAAGVMSFMGKMDLTTSIAIAVVANILGDTMLFYMSRYQKGMMMEHIKKHRRKLALSHLLMKKYGSLIIILQKFVYGIKTLIPLAIGLTKYSFSKFTILNIIASILWGLIVGIGSFMAGEPLIKMYEMVLERPYIAPLIILVFGGLIWFYLVQATKKKKA